MMGRTGSAIVGEVANGSGALFDASAAQPPATTVTARIPVGDRAGMPVVLSHGSAIYVPNRWDSTRPRPSALRV